VLEEAVAANAVEELMGLLEQLGVENGANLGQA